MQSRVAVKAFYQPSLLDVVPTRSQCQEFQAVSRWHHTTSSHPPVLRAGGQREECGISSARLAPAACSCPSCYVANGPVGRFGRDFRRRRCHVPVWRQGRNPLDMHISHHATCVGRDEVAHVKAARVRPTVMTRNRDPADSAFLATRRPPHWARGAIPRRRRSPRGVRRRRPGRWGTGVGRLFWWM